MVLAEAGWWETIWTGTVFLSHRSFTIRSFSRGVHGKKGQGGGYALITSPLLLSSDRMMLAWDDEVKK